MTRVEKIKAARAEYEKVHESEREMWLAAAREEPCTHETTEIVQREIANGGMYRRCLSCGAELSLTAAREDTECEHKWVGLDPYCDHCGAREEPRNDGREFILWSDHTWTGVGEPQPPIKAGESIRVVPKSRSAAREDTERLEMVPAQQLREAVGFLDGVVLEWLDDLGADEEQIEGVKMRADFYRRFLREDTEQEPE